jgi:hypothetical protein
MRSRFSLKNQEEKYYLVGIGIHRRINIKVDPKCGVSVWVEQARKSQWAP